MSAGKDDFVESARLNIVTNAIAYEMYISDGREDVDGQITVTQDEMFNARRIAERVLHDLDGFTFVRSVNHFTNDEGASMTDHITEQPPGPIDISSRAKPVQDIMRWFTSDHLTGDARVMARVCTEMAYIVLDTVDDDPELTAGLRKLLEAKDCFVRAAVNQSNEGAT